MLNLELLDELVEGDSEVLGEVLDWICEECGVILELGGYGQK